MFFVGIIFQLTFAVFFLFLCFAFFTGAPFVPSANKTSRRMIELAGINSSDVVYDLGSGDGRLLFLSEKKGAKKTVGLEINPLLVLYTKIRTLAARKKTVHVYWKNFWNANIGDATVVFVYLLPWKMDALAEKLNNDLKPGTKIVSNSFIFPKWKIIKQDIDQHVYVFEIP